jgi:hypothetical protein
MAFDDRECSEAIVLDFIHPVGASNGSGIVPAPIRPSAMNVTFMAIITVLRISPGGIQAAHSMEVCAAHFGVSFNSWLVGGVFVVTAEPPLSVNT